MIAPSGEKATEVTSPVCPRPVLGAGDGSLAAREAVSQLLPDGGGPGIFSLIRLTGGTAVTIVRGVMAGFGATGAGRGGAGRSASGGDSPEKISTAESSDATGRAASSAAGCSL